MAKPAGWHFQNLEVVARHRASAKLQDAELQEVIQTMAAAPLVVATMHPEPYESLNPSFQVLVRPLGPLVGVSGRQVLEGVMPMLQSGFADFELVSEIADIEVGGVQGASFTAEYTVETQDGAVFPTRATLVAVPRDSFLYQFGFSGPPEGPDALGLEVEATLRTVTFLATDQDAE